jgi:hypothetical protein
MAAVFLREVDLTIESEARHRHVDFVLARYPEVATEVRRLVTGRHAVALSERRRGAVTRPGLTAGSLNESLKSAFNRAGGWTFESSIQDGVIFDSPSPDSKREGFDLSRFDARANYAQLWTACFGRRPLGGGDALWNAVVDRFPGRFQAAMDIASRGVPGRDLAVDKEAPTVLGDIQFGNWALAYRDLLRLVDADAQIDVDLYIYVTGEQTLNSYLSEGIVTYRSITDALRLFAGLIRVPVWVLGLGLASSPE